MEPHLAPDPGLRQSLHRRNPAMSSNAPRSIDDYLKQLRAALEGEDPALIQDALYDASWISERRSQPIRTSRRPTCSSSLQALMALRTRWRPLTVTPK